MTAAWAINVVAVVSLAIGLVVFVRDVRLRERASPREVRVKLPADARGRAAVDDAWARTRPRLAKTLRQQNLELGAVWSTRDGRICGLVNGWGGFGGLTGMTRFYTDHDGFAFSVNPPSDFYMTWRACQSDRWRTLHQGSEDTGFCATRLGRRRCPELYGP